LSLFDLAEEHTNRHSVRAISLFGIEGLNPDLVAREMLEEWGTGAQGSPNRLKGSIVVTHSGAEFSAGDLKVFQIDKSRLVVC
jgi:hypothetical protein